MMYVTEAPNDVDLLAELGSMATSAPIPHGDVVFFGKWTGGADIRVCIERKKLGDMAKCVTDGRYLAQAQAASEAGFEILVLINEGVFRPGRSGLLEYQRINKQGKPFWSAVLPKIAFSRYDNYLSQLTIHTGIMVKHTTDVRHTAATIKNLWLLFRKPPEHHTSLRTMYTQPPPKTASLRKPSIIRNIAKELPGIGWGRSADVETHFSSVLDMMSADMSRWEEIEGIGPKTASAVVQAIRAKRR